MFRTEHIIGIGIGIELRRDGGRGFCEGILLLVAGFPDALRDLGQLFLVLLFAFG